jgi:phosphate starvation-inducible membrane PsiE
MDFELAVSRVKPQRHKYASLLVLECCLFLLELCLCLIIQKESHNVWQFAEANGGNDNYTIRRHSIFYFVYYHMIFALLSISLETL